MTESNLGTKILAEFNELVTDRAVFDDHYQLIGEFVHGTKQEFTEQNTPGERLNEERHNSTPIFAARQLASALIGMLWPNGARSMKLFPSSQLTDNKANKEYFEKATEQMIQSMDDPLAGLTVSLDEYMLDQVSFGTSGIGVFEGSQSDFNFATWGTTQLYINEGDEGRVDIEFRHFRWSLRRVIQTYGEENLSEQLRDRAKSEKNMSDRVELVHAIRRRTNRDVRRKGALDMPFMSVIIEKNTKHVIRESGFKENPVKVTRFRKLPYELYGRSPGMDAISDVLELDYLTERFTVNVDKTGDPPLVVLNDGRFGGGIIDTSAGAINVIDLSGRINNNIDPIKPLFTVGELNTSLTRMEQLREAIAQHFFLDKLLDFNNQTQMTAAETMLRDRIRAAALGSIFARQIAELYNPLISRCFNLLLDKGKLGVVNGSPEHIAMEQQGLNPIIIPDEIAEKMAAGENVYEIKYFTPAARMLQLERAEALNQLTVYKQTLQQTNPEAGDYFNDEEALKLAAEVGGLSSIIRSEDEVIEIRDMRKEMMQQQQQAEQAQAQSQAIKNISEAGAIAA